MNNYKPNGYKVKAKKKQKENDRDRENLVDSRASLDPWHNLKRTMVFHFFEPDTQAIRVVCSAVAAHRLQGAPVWVILMGPPSSGKRFLEGFRGHPNTHLLDQVTKATFLSGQMGVEAPSKSQSAI